MDWNSSITGGRMTPKSLNLSGISGRTPISSRRRSLLTIGKKSSRYSTNSRAAQSQKLIAVTPHHMVESFGVSLPVLVTEALTYADRCTVGSVRISPSGWAWLVTGRRLFVWQYRQLQTQTSNFPGSGGRSWAMTGQCRELNLPPSDLSHKADLVCIITIEGHNVPSCMAVTPEGTVRYWPSIAHEGTSVEDNADLQGQECDSLTYLGPHGCLLATTTSTIVMVVPQVIDGRHSIFCRTLKTPQGWLGGISRKVSSLIFGSITASQVMEVRISRVIAVPPNGGESSRLNEDAWKVYLLTGHSMQHWLIGESEQLIAEYDLDRISREAFQQVVWGGEAGLAGESKVWLLDMQLVEGGFMVLAAAVNLACSHMMHYAFGTIYMDNISQPVKFASFIPIKHTSYYHEEEELKSWNFHFVLHGTNAIIFNYKSILCTSVASAGEEPDRIEFMTSDDRVLGGALCGNVPLFFLKNHGLISILPCDGPVDVFNSSVMGDSNISDQSQIQQFSEGINVSTSELEEMSANKDSTARLSAAFLHYIQKDQAKCDSLLHDLFPASVMGRSTTAGEPRKLEVDNPIDLVVVAVSQKIINDIPNGDPRWSDAKQTTASIKSTNSLQILNQLQGKQNVIGMFLDFLKNVNLWDKFSALTVRGMVQSTAYVLAEHEEKVVAAISLKTLHTEHNSILDPVIKRVQSERGSPMFANLTHIDLFFQEVSKVHEALQYLCKFADEVAQSNRSPDEIASTLAEVNTIILAVLQEVVQFRQQNAVSFSTASSGMEYMPWTAAPGRGGLRDALLLLHSVTLKNGARLAGDASLRNQLYDQVVNLVDIILDGCKCHLESVQGTDKYAALLQQYEAERTNYIKPFFEDKEYERAAVLAEKYCDFEILVLMCDATGNDERLKEYQEKFVGQGFSNFLYGWYVREQKQGELLEKFKNSTRAIGSSGATLSWAKSMEGIKTTPPQIARGRVERTLRNQTQKDALCSFLSNHPSISWMLDAFDGEHQRASATLRNLASKEKDSIDKKKSMLSLAKLALFTSREEMGNAKDIALDWINSQLDLIAHQESLPESTVIRYAYEVDRMPVLTPAEIIKLYVADDCDEARECEFSKALDLLPYVEDMMERDELWLMIWCKAILRDEWIDVDSCVPVETCQKKLFFKLVEFALLMGRMPHEVLPPLDKIMGMEDLGSLRESSSFQYLLKVGYEYYLKL